MFHNPCRQSSCHTSISVISLIFLIVSSSGLALTYQENLSFLNKNREVLIPFLSFVTGVSGILFIGSFLSINWYRVFCCCLVYRNSVEYDVLESSEENESLYDNVDHKTSTNNDKKDKKDKNETDSLYPKLENNVSSNINIPRRSKI